MIVEVLFLLTVPEISLVRTSCSLGKLLIVGNNSLTVMISLLESFITSKYKEKLPLHTMLSLLLTLILPCHQSISTDSSLFPEFLV